jgi:hypothetical protein
MGRLAAYRLAIAAAIVSIAGIVAPHAARGEVTAAEVDESIRQGREFLLARQQTDGSWGEDHLSRGGGVTALTTLALLNCGMTRDDPPIKKALDFLEATEDPRQTYSASLAIMAFAQAEPSQYRAKIAKLAAFLTNAQRKNAAGWAKGGWRYDDRDAQADNSNTQFAMLALHEAERVGVEVDDQVWRLAYNYWTQPGMQNPDGGYGYQPGHASTGSMTCAAIAALILARDRLSPGDAAVIDGRLQCCGNQVPAESLDGALQWMVKHFSVSRNPSNDPIGSASWVLYYLYGMERVGRMSGQRLLGDHDWYREGCEHLLAQQRATLNGSFKGGHFENDPVVATSLALLFLGKGRRPVVISKLQHQPDPLGGSLDWDHHRRAIQHLTMRVEKNWRQDLSWQTIDIRKAKSAADFLETPVLFISGSDGLALAAEQKSNLKAYIENGGFLFVEACNGNGCVGEQFDRDFRALMKELFPDSPLRKLPPDHAVWYTQEKVDPKHLPRDPEFWLWGLDACCRTSVIYCPRSLSCYWELAHPHRASALPPAIASEVEAVLRIGVNVVSYATNRELKAKLDRPQIAVSIPGGPSLRGALIVPKLSHGGGADDAPNALNNLLGVMEQQLRMRVDYQRRMIAPGDEKLFDHPLLFLHGRRSFSFTPTERKAIKDYLDRGGFLFADSICASKEFADAFRAELKAIYPEASFTRIPPSHPMFSEEFLGFNLQSVTLRDPTIRTEDDPLEARLVKTTPLLEGLEVDGRYVAILSPYDISCALEKGASLECKGYTQQDAARVAANVILYALQQ